ncbi:MAG: hypothetical protein JW889_16480 [Verrucomicrobia bacterium]|nr:hypothetical protein [Verrucomicrobiota bacterium]
MSPHLREERLQVPGEPPDESVPIAEGTRFKYTYFQFTVDVRAVVPVAYTEVPDERLLVHLEGAGCFDYLADPGEDIYTIEDGEPL